MSWKWQEKEGREAECRDGEMKWKKENVEEEDTEEGEEEDTEEGDGKDAGMEGKWSKHKQDMDELMLKRKYYWRNFR